MKEDTRLVEEIIKLNTRLEKNASLGRVFSVGIVYGIGFFVGSAILAVIALGIFGPMLANISWVEENFKRGSTILHEQQ